MNGRNPGSCDCPGCRFDRMIAKAADLLVTEISVYLAGPEVPS